MLSRESYIPALVVGALLTSFGCATPSGMVTRRNLVAAGGWSLSTEDGTGSCPAGTATCFSLLTGKSKTQNRGENCCPAGTTPRLDCGTFVNTGQPFACCPLGNPDCRGDVGKSDETDLCANSGWALWHVPFGGGNSLVRGVNGTSTTLNSFCCLPGSYGYFFPRFGQDAVGQCSTNKILPNGALPAVQDNNGDGTVGSNGTQLTELPAPPPTRAPTCDLISYGWSLQTRTSECTPGSNLCNYGGACCPTSLNCGSVIGDSEVAPCCPPGNPDCRGDVEGLFPQVCADSSWALWHVNTNGNHFCCLPGQIGYNLPLDNTAVGFCGSSVPNGTVRSILDYEGDGSTPGSFLRFPCDSNPAPNDTYSSITSAILNPPSTLNPGPPIATGLYPNTTEAAPITMTKGQTYTTTTISFYTITSCPPVVTDCPAKMGHLTTEVVTIITTYCPLTSTGISLTNGPIPITEGYPPTGAAGNTFTKATASPSARFTGGTSLLGGSAVAAGIGVIAAALLQ